MPARSQRSESMGLFGALFTFLTVSLYLFYTRCSQHIVLAVGVTFLLYATSGGDLTGSLLAGALLSLAIFFFMGPRRNSYYDEGFQNSTDEDTEAGDETDVSNEEVVAKPAPKKKTGTAPPPDHGDRAEMFELGKKYKMPVSEKEDTEFHLDAGTTFMNAYKSLKPEQIAAMTKDTQELMETQKQLMSTLHTLKPLISDGKQMMEMFQSYFGSGSPTTV